MLYLIIGYQPGYFSGFGTWGCQPTLMSEFLGKGWKRSGIGQPDHKVA